MTGPSSRTLRLALCGVAVLVALGCALGIGVRSTYGARAAVDEPQYLLTAISLAEDADLDISDELAANRARDFHEARLPRQTRDLGGGREVSPHDPLLPLMLAGPMRFGGLVAAKATIALLAGLLAALVVWTAVRRLSVPLPLAATGTSVLALSPPLAVYGSQVYPEMPAALVVTAAVALLLGRRSRRAVLGVVACVTALPWLSVKYVPLAAVLAVLLLGNLIRNDRRRHAATAAGGLVVMAIAYAVLHRVWYGGWTVYAAGDHFASSGELGVVGFRPDYVGRSSRLVGLLVDRDFGLAPWQPAWLLLAPAIATMAVQRRRGWPPMLLPLLAGWATATWIALTMHGFWWPGRQVVAVLPLAALYVLAWAARSRVRAALLVGSGALGVLSYAWLLVDGWAGRLTWVSGFAGVGNPVYRAFRLVLPDYRDLGPRTWALHVAWAAVLVLTAAAALRRGRQQTVLNRPSLAREVVRT